MARLYLLTPAKINIPAFCAQFAQLAKSENIIAYLQLRLPEAKDDEILKAADALLPICAAHKINFIINNRADLAKKSGADGVHLGQQDMSLAEARALLGADKRIGITCHASPHLAQEASEAGADYVAFGAFYPSPTKPDAKPCPPNILRDWKRASPNTLNILNTPCVAIGGITPANAAPLIEAGADFIAASSGVWQHQAGAPAALAAFAKIFNDARK